MRRLSHLLPPRLDRLAALAVANTALFVVACTPDMSGEDTDTSAHSSEGEAGASQPDAETTAMDAISAETAIRARHYSQYLEQRTAKIDLESEEGELVRRGLDAMTAELSRLAALDESRRVPRNAAGAGVDDIELPPNPEDACPADADYIVKGTGQPDFLFATKPKTCVLGLASEDVLGATSVAVESTLIGGGGDDWMVAASGTKNTTFVGNGGDDVVLGTIRADRGTGDGGVDLVWLAAGPDVFDAGVGDDFVSAGGGRDELVGGNGQDLILPGPGDDHVRAGGGDDVVVEGLGDANPRRSGDDVVYPGAGKDFVYAGYGDDRVVIGSMCSLERGEILVGGPGHDTLVVPTSLQDVQDAGVTVVGFESIEVATTPDHALAGGECWRDDDGKIICDCCSDGWSGRSCQTCDVPALAMGLEGQDRCIIVPVAEQLVATVSSPNARAAERQAEAMLNVARQADLGLSIVVTDTTPVDIEIEPGVQRVFTRVDYKLDHLVFGRIFGFNMPGGDQTGAFYVEGGVVGSKSYTFSESTVKVDENARYLVMLERRDYGAVVPSVDAIHRLNRAGGLSSSVLPATQTNVENAIKAVR